VGLTLTVLGASGSYPGAGQACSGYLVRSETTTLWLDCGSGSLANLQRHVALLDIDAIAISHEHPDHSGDLAGCYVASKYYLGRQRLPVFAPTSVRTAAYYADEPLAWCDVADGRQERIGDLTLTFSRTDHGPETLAVRVDGAGRSLGYSADSGPRWSLSALGPGLDLALCEATYLQNLEGKAQHMSGRQAGESAREAGAARLVVTHAEPGVDRAAVAAEAAETFGAPVDFAFEHAVFEV
jgi:ribonuclease BN (tRNA processing enzyme)